MQIIEGITINDILKNGCAMIMNDGCDVPSRNGGTKELHPGIIRMCMPKYRTLLFPHRGNNPFATLFETIWVLGSSDNRINVLRKFLPRADDYSDNPNSDESTWRAGYPERIKYYGKHKVDQLEYVYRCLRNDRHSRQAVISLWNPELDTFDATGDILSTKDRPCSNHLVFTIRNNVLDCSLTIRSNDFIYGTTSINIYEFTVMQEILAHLLDVEVGTYWHFANSLHIYDKHYDKAEKIGGVKINEHAYGLPTFEFADDEICSYYDFKCIYRYIYKFIEDNFTSNAIDFIEQSVFAVEICKLCKLYLDYVNMPVDIASAESMFNKVAGTVFKGYVKTMQTIRNTDLKLACHYWFLKHWKAIPTEDTVTAYNQIIKELSYQPLEEGEHYDLRSM